MYLVQGLSSQEEVWLMKIFTWLYSIQIRWAWAIRRNWGSWPILWVDIAQISRLAFQYGHNWRSFTEIGWHTVSSTSEESSLARLIHELRHCLRRKYRSFSVILLLGFLLRQCLIQFSTLETPIICNVNSVVSQVQLDIVNLLFRLLALELAQFFLVCPSTTWEVSRRFRYSLGCCPHVPWSMPWLPWFDGCTLLPGCDWVGCSTGVFAHNRHVLQATGAAFTVSMSPYQFLR